MNAEIIEPKCSMDDMSTWKDGFVFAKILAAQAG